MSALTYSNPLWEGTCADPLVLRHGDFYYCYGTGETGDSRKFITLRSPDLVQWEPLGGALDPLPGHENAEFWAPEVAFANGKFWMYYSDNGGGGEDSTQRLRVAVADAPEGPFRTVTETLFPNEGFTIDASPFCDPQTGKWYLYFARDLFENRVGTGTAVVALSEDMQSAVGLPVPVAVASADWQIYERNRTIYNQLWDAWHTVEGPFVVFHEGKYICFYSGGNYQNDSYGVSFAMAEHPLGPWLDEWSEQGAAVLRTMPGVIGPGHNSAVLAPDGQTWMCVYHAWNAEGTRRQLCIDPIQWTSDGPRVTPTSDEQQLQLKN